MCKYTMRQSVYVFSPVDKVESEPEGEGGL